MSAFASVYRNFEDVDEFSRSGARSEPRPLQRRSKLASPMFSAADHDYHGAGTASQPELGLYLDHAQSTRRLSSSSRTVQARRRRLAPPAPAQPHAEIHALQRSGQRGPRRHRIRYPRTLQPPRANAALRRSADRCGGDPGGRGHAAIPIRKWPGARLVETARLPVFAAECGLLETEARELNIGFVSRMTHGSPLGAPETGGQPGREKQPCNNGVSASG